uniref:Uncharacterized protein n=1 Tax=Corethron hystrix TaxID=216773 RepID=A0A7S1BDM8_9STRA
MDVICFAYAPLARALEGRVADLRDETYLVDQSKDTPPTYMHPNDHSDWSLVQNQIFLGLLGSAVHPRQEIEYLIPDCSDAGVRFVYFSPRNMRRTKEVASKMGIDVGWNCAISLRSLSGDPDPHRMQSSYGDWDVNARLPHGIDEIRTHLDTVDNVPLLVSLFTDVTENTTSEMVNIFQEHHDTVLAIGHTHRFCNERTFSAADLAVGIDVLSSDGLVLSQGSVGRDVDMLRTCDLRFISSVGSHSCIFNLRGASSVRFFPDIIRRARASHDAAEAAAFFFHLRLPIVFLSVHAEFI